jgi:hypothetical protein
VNLLAAVSAFLTAVGFHVQQPQVVVVDQIPVSGLARGDDAYTYLSPTDQPVVLMTREVASDPPRLKVEPLGRAARARDRPGRLRDDARGRAPARDLG